MHTLPISEYSPTHSIRSESCARIRYNPQNTILQSICNLSLSLQFVVILMREILYQTLRFFLMYYRCKKIFVYVEIGVSFLMSIPCCSLWSAKMTYTLSKSATCPDWYLIVSSYPSWLDYIPYFKYYPEYESGFVWVISTFTGILPTGLIGGIFGTYLPITAFRASNQEQPILMWEKPAFLFPIGLQIVSEMTCSLIDGKTAV